MAYGLPNGHVTDDVTWPPKLLWGSTVGYLSDSLDSCYLFMYVPRLHRRTLVVIVNFVSDEYLKRISEYNMSSF